VSLMSNLVPKVTIMVAASTCCVYLLHSCKKGKTRIALFWVLLKFGLRNTFGLRK
jgi:hypothetical protein